MHALPDMGNSGLRALEAHMDWIAREYADEHAPVVQAFRESVPACSEGHWRLLEIFRTQGAHARSPPHVADLVGTMGLYLTSPLPHKKNI
jgi:hypothetical protein